jgi:AcrR family transcriptional regulator
MAAVAARVGVSRQTLYHEFGTRDGLLAALVARENDAILREVTVALERHPHDLPAAAAAGVLAVLQRSADDPFAKALLGGGDLLPLFTTRAKPLLQRSNEALLGYAQEHYPEVDPADLRVLVDVVVGLAHSHLVLARDPPQQVAAQISRLVARFLHGLDTRSS